MLNKRQNQIVKELTNTKELITAKYLADKYGVSIRTIRNDVIIIIEHLKDIDVEFIRKHGIGMRIVSKNYKTTQNLLDTNIYCKDFIYYDKVIRNVLISIYFVMNKNPISAQELSDRFFVSKGTILNEINSGVGFIKDLEIKGVRNKGFVICSNEFKQLSLINKISNLIGSKQLEMILFEKNNCFVDEYECELVNSCCDYLSNNLYLTISNHSGLRISIVFLLAKVKNNRISATHKKINSFSTLGRFQLYFEHISSAVLETTHLELLKYLLSQYTDYTDDEKSDYSKLEIAVDDWIQAMSLHYPMILEEKDSLHIDLVKHIKSLINSSSFNVENGNVLLKQIKERYGDIFEEVKKTSVGFSSITDLYFNDDEIGYITLYFCKVLDKINKMRSARVMVVCNTGRGASKFLATRIINNCPEVHVVAMNSYVDIEKDKSILQNIDLIISTINLPMVKIPYIVISPLLTELELSKVKEAIWISQSKTSNLLVGDINSTVEYSVETMMNYKKGKQFEDLTNIQNDKIQYNIETATLFSSIEIEIADFINKILPNGIDSKENGVLTGLRVHILMAIPRWNRKEFSGLGRLEETIISYPRESSIVIDFLKKLSSILKIEIANTEVTAIMEYIKILKAEKRD